MPAKNSGSLIKGFLCKIPDSGDPISVNEITKKTGRIYMKLIIKKNNPRFFILCIFVAINGNNK